MTGLSDILSTLFGTDNVDAFLDVVSLANQLHQGEPEPEVNQGKKEALLQEWSLATKTLALGPTLQALQQKGVVLAPDLTKSLLEMNPEDARLLLGINALCQKALLRPAGTERQQLDDKALESFRPFLTERLTILGLVDEVAPTNLKPEVLPIFGAAEPTIHGRYQEFARYHVELKVAPDTVYLLGGQRPLWAVHEAITTKLVAERIAAQPDNKRPIDEILEEVDVFFTKQAMGVDRTKTEQINAFRDTVINHFTSNYKITWPTEIDMMARIAKNNSAFAEQKIIPVDTPMQKDPVTGRETRPNTRDTIVSMKQLLPGHVGAEKTTVLAISSQPHVKYQRVCLLDVLGTDQFDIEVVGKGQNPVTLKLRESLDAIARTIFAGLPVALGRIAEQSKAATPSPQLEQAGEAARVDDQLSAGKSDL